MGILTIRLPNEKHERLRLLARRRRVSMNKLTVVLAQSDAETRFQVRAARGSIRKALRLLDKLDQSSHTG